MSIEKKVNGEKEKKTERILQRIVKERGFVRLWPQLLAERDPDYMECIHNMTMHPLHNRSSLPTKVKELILISLNAPRHKLVYKLFKFTEILIIRYCQRLRAFRHFRKCLITTIMCLGNKHLQNC